VSPESPPEAPPAGEEIHLPGPSFLPIVMAVGITLGVIGITIHFLITAVGVIIFLATLVPWLREVREEIAELPLEHDPH
jgi:hypothetical protein